MKVDKVVNVNREVGKQSFFDDYDETTLNFEVKPVAQDTVVGNSSTLDYENQWFSKHLSLQWQWEVKY